jgi:hypothetical protein
MVCCAQSRHVKFIFLLDSTEIKWLSDLVAVSREIIVMFRHS